MKNRLVFILVLLVVLLILLAFAPTVDAASAIRPIEPDSVSAYISTATVVDGNVAHWGVNGTVVVEVQTYTIECLVGYENYVLSEMKVRNSGKVVLRYVGVVVGDPQCDLYEPWVPITFTSYPPLEAGKYLVCVRGPATTICDSIK